MTSRRPRMRWYGVFGLPILIGVAAGGGLAAGLIGDGGWDVVAWIGLSLPGLVIPATLRRSR